MTKKTTKITVDHWLQVMDRTSVLFETLHDHVTTHEAIVSSSLTRDLAERTEATLRLLYEVCSRNIMDFDAPKKRRNRR